MTTIRTTCNRCGDVELTADDLGLELTSNTGTGNYRFECPFCGVTQRRPANHRVVSILMATGVTYCVINADGPITESEILAFREELELGTWYTELPAG
jgi:hypothetical protein